MKLIIFNCPIAKNETKSKYSRVRELSSTAFVVICCIFIWLRPRTKSKRPLFRTQLTRIKNRNKVPEMASTKVALTSLQVHLQKVLIE